MRKLTTLIILLLFPLLVQASPVGYWRAYDLDGTPRSIVKISLTSKGELRGQMIKLLHGQKGQRPDLLCMKCPGKLRNTPLVGMTVLRGLKKQGNQWEEGKVLDTDTGKRYYCQISISPDNQTLHLRAYIFLPLLGKTIDWTRVK